jgi:hypothetical protein
VAVISAKRGRVRETLEWVALHGVPGSLVGKDFSLRPDAEAPVTHPLQPDAHEARQAPVADVEALLAVEVAAAWQLRGGADTARRVPATVLIGLSPAAGGV